MKRSVYICAYFLCFAFGINPAFSQKEKTGGTDAERDLLIEKMVESMAENSEENIDYTTLFQDLIDYYENPLNLNSASLEDIEKFRFLTAIQIENFWAYLEKHRPLYSIFELSLIKGFDEETIQDLSSFITIAPVSPKQKITLKQFFKGSSNELFLRYGQTLQRAKGYRLNDSDPEAGYLGSPQAYFLRYRFRYKDKVSLGFSADKDAGEQFFRGAQKQGFDFYSAHLFVRNVSVFKQIALGDFSARFGQGLVFWTGLAFGKSAFGNSIMRKASGFAPYTSVNESQFLRGGGITLNPVKGMDISLFSSYKKLDGNVVAVNDSLNEADLEITSLPLSGVHRTTLENEKRRTVSEWVSGGNISYRYKNFKLGVTAIYTKLGARFAPSDDAYKRFAFSGRELGNLGMHYAYVYKNFSFFGETAWSSNGGWASINGIQGAPVTFLSFSLYHRYFSNRYAAFYASAISESASRSGEQGFYMGLDCKPVSGVSIGGYIDIFTFSWLRYQTAKPSNGYDLLGQISFRPSRKLDLYLRYRHRTKQENVSADTPPIGVKPVENRETGRLRLHVNWQASTRIRLQARTEWVRYKPQSRKAAHGFLSYLDASYSALKKPFSVHGRFEVFHTEGFETRLYALESDVLYYYGFVPLYDKGLRYYFSFRYQVFKNMDIWMKLGNTHFLGKTFISSGNGEIQGNNRTDLRVQVRFKI